MVRKFYSFEGDMKGTVTRKKTRKTPDMGDNLNGSSLDNYFIQPEDEQVYLSLLPPGGAAALAGLNSSPIDKTALAKNAAAVTGGSGPATEPAATTPAVIQPVSTPAAIPATPVAQSTGSAPPLPTTAQIDKMSCATMETTLDSVTANSAYYQANRLGVESVQIAQYLTKKIASCNAAAQPPVISVSGPQSVTLPQNSVTIDASGSSDPAGGNLTYRWTLVSGPNSPAITGPTGSVASFSNLVQGNYIFQLTVTNTSNLSSTQNVSVTVSPAASAGGDTGGTGIIGNAPVTIATTAPVELDSTSPYSDPGVADSGGGGGGGGAAPADDSGADTVVAGVVIPVWAQWVAVGLIVAGTIYILSGKDE